MLVMRSHAGAWERDNIASLPHTGNDCMDAGDRVTHGAVTEGLG